MQQAFKNYDFLHTKFCTHKPILVARPCMWEIVPVEEQTCTLLVITYDGIKCTKLVLKPMAAKSGLFVSVLCTAPFL